MTKNNTKYLITPIGTLYKENGKQRLALEREYRKGLKLISQFSHIIIIYKPLHTPANVIPSCLSQKAVKIYEADEKTGILTIDGSHIEEEVLELYDIKAYFPNEDCVKDCFTPHSPGKPESPGILAYNGFLPLGTIHKEKGEYFLEIPKHFHDYAALLEGYSHIKICWWFDKFDKPVYRKTLDCQPPYENAPRTGVFASRSPVRPNPIALTTARILSIEEARGRIKVSQLDCFDKTPFLGFSLYQPETDRVEDCRLPDWLAHWPKWLDDRGFEKTGEVHIGASSVEILKKYKDNQNTETAPDPADIFLTSDDENRETHADGIVIKGARQNNLKNIDVTIPYGKITVMTGVSGSGKSSLAFDTIFAESQQRFFESMSLSERASFKLMDKPKFDQITGLPPAIAISQRNINRNPRSTVGTMSDMYDLLRSLFANIGVRHCPECGQAIEPLTAFEIIRLLQNCTPGTVQEIGPIHSDSALDTFIVPELGSEDMNSTDSYYSRLKSSVEKALKTGSGAITVKLAYPGNPPDELHFQTTQMCYHCDHVLFELTPASFSFNNPESMCPVCKGLGRTMEPDVHKIITNPELSLLDGASPFWGNLRKFMKSPNANWMKGEVLALAMDEHIDLELPWKDLPEAFREKALFGAGEKEVSFTYENRNGRNGTITRKVEGAYHIIHRLLQSSSQDTAKQIEETYMTAKTCDSCNGERLFAESRMVTIADTRFPDVVQMSLEELRNWITALPDKLEPIKMNLAFPILKTMYKRLSDYISAGLSYLTLDRPAPTLSGGELQRLLLVTQLSSGISNILYILDEPTTGLHPKDTHKLLTLIKKLRDLGNTVIVVEHGIQVMLAADKIIDIGPSAGEAGGYITAQGTPKELMQNRASETGAYLSGKKLVSIPGRTPAIAEDKWVCLEGVNGNNLKNISISFPVNAITCITGVSGSGKSTLVAQGILPGIQNYPDGKNITHSAYASVTGAGHFDKIIHITQKPIGRSSRSTPATYTGIMDEIRILFAQTDAAREKHFKQSHFSFNSKDGQCPVCHGYGYQSLDTHFMPSATVECPMCKGRKFHDETLAVSYNGKNIAEVMDMSIDEALLFFSHHRKLSLILQTLNDIGLGYLKLGQSSQTLSGGEAQRIKLATELSVSPSNRALYLLDEPTTGLHFSDIQNLLIILDKIVQNKNTVILIEHNLQVIKNADWIIDLGPEGGTNGGYVVCQGTPKDVCRCKESYTGEMLKRVL